MTPLRLLMVVNTFRPVVGGGERQTEQLARTLVSRGHDVTVLTRRLKTASPCEELVQGLRIIRVSGVTRWGYSLAMLSWIFRHRFEFDLVHAHQTYSSLVVSILSSRLWGLPVVCSPMTRWPELDWTANGLKGTLRRWLYRDVRIWIAKSGEIADALEAFSPGLIHGIPNGVDVTWFSPAAERGERLPTVIFVGRLEPPKRVDLLLKAWQEIHCVGRLIIVGDGSLRGELQTLADQLGLSEVTFVGAQTDVRDSLHNADVFVLLSDLEGMPNALLEAMSCGLACIGSAVGAVPELLGNGTGILVPPGDPTAVAKALELLLRDLAKCEELGRRARRVARERYDLALVAQAVERAYYCCLKAGR